MHVYRCVHMYHNCHGYKYIYMYICIYMYRGIYIYIYIYVFVYVYIEKATASAADLWDPRLGCLDARMLVFLLACLVPELGRI